MSMYKYLKYESHEGVAKVTLNRPEVYNALNDEITFEIQDVIKKIAKEMRNALVKKDLYKFAKLMNEETAERKRLHKSTVGPRLQKFIDKGFKNGAIAAKICGSGGGGSILFFTDKKSKLIKAFGNNVINFKFDFGGLKWI